MFVCFALTFLQFWQDGLYYLRNDLSALRYVAMCSPGTWVSMDMYMCYRRLKILKERLTPLDECEFGESTKGSDFETE